METSFSRETISESAIKLKVTGSIGSEAYPSFSSEIENLISSGKKDITIDLDDVDYLSSKCVSLIEKLLDSSYENDGNITIVSHSDNIRKILEITGYDELLSDFEESNE